MKYTGNRNIKYCILVVLVAVMLSIVAYVYLSGHRGYPNRIPVFSLEGMESQVIEKIEHIVAQIKTQPHNDELWGLLGMNLQAHVRPAQAISCYKEAHRLDKDDFRWAYLCGYTLDELNEGDPIQWYRKALTIDPSYAPAHVRIGKLMLANSQQDKAEEVFQKALFYDKRLSHAYVGLGQIEYNRGQIAVALEYAQKALAINDEHRDAYALLINCHRNLGNQEMVRYFSKKIEDLPRIVLMNERIFQKLSAEGVSFSWYRKRGVKLMERGSYAKAEKELKSALEIKSTADDVHQDIGIVLTRLNQTEEAISHFRQAVEIKSNNAEYLSNLGTALYQLGNVEEGMIYLEQAFEIDPGYEHSCLNLAISLQKKNQWQKAVDVYRTGLSASPDNLVLSFGLAWLLATAPGENIRNSQEALKLAEKLVQKSKHQDARILDVWAAAYAEDGNFQKAERTIKKAIQILEKSESEPLLLVDMKKRLQGYHQKQPWRISNNR